MPERFDKLVRDRIPEIIEGNGEKPVFKRVGDDEVRDYVLEKVVEEARELEGSGDLEEVADLLEVVDRFLELEEVSKDEVERLREEKCSERGVLRRISCWNGLTAPDLNLEPGKNTWTGIRWTRLWRMRSWRKPKF